MIARRGLAAVLFACLSMPCAIAAEGEFETTVAPILKQHCVACHGERKEEGELRLDTLGRDFSNGRLAGRWREVADRIRLGEMPPEDQPKLSAGEAKKIVDWITQQLESAQSAKGHWAFQPLKTVKENALPQVSSDDGWGRNEVDRFVLSKLRAAGLSPSEEADRVTLLRRVTFDLIGLPPTPDEVGSCPCRS